MFYCYGWSILLFPLVYFTIQGVKYTAMGSDSMDNKLYYFFFLFSIHNYTYIIHFSNDLDSTKVRYMAIEFTVFGIYFAWC